MNPIDNPVGAETRENEGTRQTAADAASLLIRMEQVPFSKWHANARIVMGSATFFDAFNALSLAFALPTLVRLWHISPKQIGFLISASYVGQLAGALVFSALAEKVGRIRGTTGRDRHHVRHELRMRGGREFFRTIRMPVRARHRRRR